MAYVMYQWTLERELYLGNVYTGFAGKGKKALAKRSTLVVTVTWPVINNILSCRMRKTLESSKKCFKRKLERKGKPETFQTLTLITTGIIYHFILFCQKKNQTPLTHRDLLLLNSCYTT